MWVIASVTIIAFAGALSLSRVLWKSAYSSSNTKPKSIPQQAQKWIEELLFVGFRCFATLYVPFPFIFLSCCTRFLSCSFHVPFMFLSFVFKFCSFHTPFICIHVLSSSFHLPLVFLPSSFHLPFIFLSSSFQFACMFLSFSFMSFHLLSQVLEMIPRLGPGTECNKWLALSCREDYR